MGHTTALRDRQNVADPSASDPGEDPSETAYVGGWTPLGRAVFTHADGELQALRLSQPALVRGYAWGRAGSGPREVARAILLDATGNEMLAERLCRPYTWEVISQLPTEGFRITKKEVLAWIDK
jgi:hypothetical protein